MANEVTIRLGVAGLRETEAAFQRLKSSATSSLKSIGQLAAEARVGLGGISNALNGLGAIASSLASVNPALGRVSQSIADTTSSVAGLASGIALLKNAGVGLRGGVYALAAVAGVEVTKAMGYVVQQFRDAAATGDNLAASNRRAAESFNQLLAVLNKGGFVGDAQAAALRASASIESESFLGDMFGEANKQDPGALSARLNAMGAELVRVARYTSQSAVYIHRAASMARLEASQTVIQAETAAELEAVKQRFDLGKISLDDALTERRRLVTRNADAERQLLLRQDFEARALLGSLEDVKKSSQIQTIEDIAAKRKVLEIELQRDLARITAEGELERLRIAQAERAKEPPEPLGPEPAPPQEGWFGGDPNSFTDQWTRAFREVRREWGTVAENIASVGQNAMRGLTRTVGNVLDDMIWRSNSLADIWQSFAHLLTSTVTQAISQMFMQWIAGIVAKKGATVAAESAEATAKAPTALMESIKSYGIAAAVGVAALVAAMAAFGGFREQGGPVEAGSAYIVGERRPELFIPSTAGVILPSVNGAAPSSSGAGMPGGDDRPMRVVVVSDRRLAADLAKDSAYRTQIVDIMRQEQWRFRG